MSSLSSISSDSTRNFKRAHRRSMLSSTGSDIQFTRKKLTHQYKLGCIIIAIFLVLLLFAAGAVYVGFSYYAEQFPGPLIYRGTFKITDGDVYTNELADTSSRKFKVRSRDYRERLNLLYRRSPIKHGFGGTEILALDGVENQDLVIHFTINVDPMYIKAVDEELLENIILDDIRHGESIIFKDLKIEENSVNIMPNNDISQPSSPSTVMLVETTTQMPRLPKECVPIDLPYCSKMSYKTTSYPNIFDHENLKDVEENLIPFRELIDAECYNHTYQFVCNVLQPYCLKADVNVLPCRSFCRYFMAGCGDRLPEKLRQKLDCNNFLEYEGENCLIEPDCGVQKLRSTQIFTKTANIGDWPWHVALLKNNVHICDGTLISPSWIATTSSCFQGQPKAEWMAKLGSVRLSLTHPSEVERRVIGMVKSPVEGSTIALVKLDQPIMITENIRPICLPQREVDMSETCECNTVGWSRDTEQLKRIQVRVTSMKKCENISIANLNSICAEVAYGQENCHEEEFAGSPVMCINPSTSTWSIVGVTNWRIACSRNGMVRPRMYDKISSNINWIHETLNSDEYRNEDV
ncbi:coagulation factor VII [Coccinella septempunctata]|uniref:coagulation factor VII n=1 Tax=Coccinella septempunctata TaxID=41139 RepID=UPI001D05FDE2|nr:coagulation factor VII [Coccinella septempunctata]XP_044754899.1 coagulation factor VII [Coccinella septempunctata]XP_044754900.1 coagulation factor VII [Coccinella septempunctata]XP_044754901.1 coagulation factor VII [Coccinella septempunctata]